jgi:hypothetical protein
MRQIGDGTYEDDLTSLRNDELRDFYAEDQDDSNEPASTIECDICEVRIPADLFPPLCHICAARVLCGTYSEEGRS